MVCAGTFPFKPDLDDDNIYPSLTDDFNCRCPHIPPSPIKRLHICQVGKMAIFQSKKFRPSAQANTIAARYRSALAKHPFALFGLPFIATMVAGSFFLTPATAIRYEKHDRRVQRLSKDEELGIGKNARKVDMKEEYYVSFPENALCSRDCCLEAYADSFTETGRERSG